MNDRAFLRVADSLLLGNTEEEWRTAVSRAYYAAFHVARSLVRNCGFTIPAGATAHAFLWLRLSNSSHPTVQTSGADLKTLHRARAWADYDLARSMNRATAAVQVQFARDLIAVLDAAALEPIRTEITDGMKSYERDVLKNVTWQP